MAQQGRGNVGGGEVGALTRPNEYLTYGMKGFFITTNSSWSDCVKDAYQLLQKHHEGEEPGATSDSSTPSPLFRVVATGVSKIVFIATGVESPTELAYKIFEDVISIRPRSESQHVNRFLPVELTVFCNNLEEVQPKLQKLLEKRLPKGHMTFRVVFNSNNCNLKIRPGEFLQMVTCMVSKINPLGDLDLKDADYTIVGEAVKQVLCLGIVKNFKKYAKYNLAEAASSQPATPIPAHFWELAPATTSSIMESQNVPPLRDEGLTAASSVETASPPSTTNGNGTNQSDADGATSVDTSLSPLTKLDVGSQTSNEQPPEQKDESHVVTTLASPAPSSPDITDMYEDIGDMNNGTVETQTCSENIVTKEGGAVEDQQVTTAVTTTPTLAQEDGNQSTASSSRSSSPSSTTNVNGTNRSDADRATNVDTSLSPLTKLVIDAGSQTSNEQPTLGSPAPSAPDISEMYEETQDRNDGPVETQSSNIVTKEEVTGSSDSESTGVPLASGEDAEANAGVTVLEGKKVGKVPTTTPVVDASTIASSSENGGGLNGCSDPAQTSLTTPKEGLPVTDPSHVPGTPSGDSTKSNKSMSAEAKRETNVQDVQEVTLLKEESQIVMASKEREMSVVAVNGSETTPAPSPNSTPAEVGTERNAEDGKEASPNMVTPESRVFPMNFVLQTNNVENTDVGSQTSIEKPSEPKALASLAPSAPHISEMHEETQDLNNAIVETQPCSENVATKEGGAVEDQQVTTTPTLTPEDRNQSTASSSSSPPPPATAVNGSNQLDADGDAEPANINTPNSPLDENGGAVVTPSQFSMTEDIVDVVSAMDRQMEEFSANFQAFNMELATVLHGKIEEFAARLHGMVDGKKDGEGFN